MLFALIAPVPAFAATFSVWVQNGSDRVFSSTPVPSAPATAVTLHAARGETQAAQIAVRSGSAVDGLSVQTGDLTGPGGAVIPATAVTSNREYNHTGIPTGLGHFESPPGGGNAYYDSFYDNAPFSLAAGVTQPFYLSVAVPAGQAPGAYFGTATVRSSAGNVTVPLRVTVYNVTLPPTSQSTFKMDNWFGSAGWDYEGTVQAIPLQYGVTMFDDNWWKVIGNIAGDFAKHRNNVIHADFQGLAMTPATTFDAGGLPVLDWANFDRFVQTFIDAGALQYIYTPHMLRGDGTQLVELRAGAGGAPVTALAATGTPAAAAYLDSVFGQLKTHLDGKCLDAQSPCPVGRRWSDVLYMSAVDEPTTQAQTDAANWFYDRFHARFPNGLTNEAQWVIASGDHGRLSTLTPMLNTDNYGRNIAYYQSQRIDQKKDLWFYTSANHDAQPNRMISYPLVDTRLMPWMATSVNADGLLHWGWNYWVSGGPGNWSAADTFDGAQGNDGDCWLVRPDKAHYGIYDSVRSEALLQGLQDTELLHQLAAAKPVAARSLVNSLISDTTTYERYGSFVEERHKQLLDALVAPGGDLKLPFADDFGSGTDANWRHSAGSWSVTGDGAYVQSSTDTGTWNVVSGLEARAYGDLAASVDLQITGVNAADGGNANWAGVVVHNLNPTDHDTGDLVAVRNTGEVFVYRSGSTLGHAQIPGYNAGQLVHLRVVARGSTLQVYAGGAAPLLTVTDGSYPVGGFGLATGGASARFDNVRINPMVNPVEGAAVSVSSSYTADAWSPQNAVDGRRDSSLAVSNGWTSAGSSSADHTEWIQTDLGAVTPLNRVDLFPRNDGAATGFGFPVDFTVQVSADGSNWTTVANRTGYPRPGAGAQSFPFATTDVRYIKVTGTKLSADPGGTYYLQLAEIEAAGGDLALGRPVTSSSSVQDSWAGWVRSAATDGVVASGLWYSAGFSSQGGTALHPEWVQVDLEGAAPIGRIDLTARTDGANTGLGFPADFTLQTSVDGTAWTTVASRTGYARPDATAQSFTFTPVTARYVRVSASRLTADQFGTYYLQLGEISVS
ncbi:discoidin domain-containing protein [Kitasatospora cinereorecta]